MIVLRLVFAATFWLATLWLLVTPLPEIDNAVLLVWLLCVVGIGFVLHRWLALPLAFGPFPLSSLYQRTAE